MVGLSCTQESAAERNRGYREIYKERKTNIVKSEKEKSK